MMPLAVWGQTVREELQADVNRSAGISYVLPTDGTFTDTAAPEGYNPFYISHYGCTTSFYLEDPKHYEAPYATLAKADSLGKLTELGRDVLHRLDLLRREASDRTGEVTASGARQSRLLMRQMVERFPYTFFEGTGYYSARSVVHNHCIETMNEAMVELSGLRQPLQMNIKASKREVPFMDPHDKTLEAQRTDSATMAAYNAFVQRNTDDRRLMASLINDSDYVATHVDAGELSRQLFTLAGNIQHTDLNGSMTLYDLFTPEEIHRHWRIRNAWNYICYGTCPTNGATQPYVQRASLRNMMHMGDSLMKRISPIVHVRYTHEEVVMALACLMELDSCGMETDDLDKLEDLGWVDYRIAPVGGSIVMVHYRRRRFDDDVLVKVLLNGHEARLPIETDCAPYYHWDDVKRYYLRKLYRYENYRFTKQFR